MKNLLLVLMLSFLAFSGFSQGNQNGNIGYLDPDSLTNITISGLAIVDTSNSSAKYYLDEDGDGNAEYFLNFGPYWYEPDSSAAMRPVDGDSISIYGGLVDSCRYSSIPFPVVIVYEIDGELWRDPFEPLWSHMGRHNHHGGSHGYAYGWRNDSLASIQATGAVILDTTFINTHYYLDEDYDGNPNYVLNFGPPWYEPQDSTLVRPEEGDIITVAGGLVERTYFPMIIVFELNGQTWRDSTLMQSNLGGQWIYRHMNQYRYIYAPYDSGDGMHVGPGWHNQTGPDSLYCQMLQLYPQNIPNTGNQNVFAGYEIGVFNRNNSNLMFQNHSTGGCLNFASQVQFQFHYNNIQLNGNNIDESTIKVKGWDNTINDWVTINNAVLDMQTNTISYSSSTVYSSIILAGNTEVTIVDEDPAMNPGEFILNQNYPNPFNPVTNIEFLLTNDTKVVLTIYNVLGEKLFEVLNQNMNAGLHTIQFNAKSLPSGIYFYELKTGNKNDVMKMTLLK